jgi:hypothetical protein
MNNFSTCVGRADDVLLGELTPISVTKTSLLLLAQEISAVETNTLSAAIPKALFTPVNTGIYYFICKIYGY